MKRLAILTDVVPACEVHLYPTSGSVGVAAQKIHLKILRVENLAFNAYSNSVSLQQQVHSFDRMIEGLAWRKCAVSGV